MPEWKLHKNTILSFQKKVWRYYKIQGRKLPWRPPAIRLRRDRILDPYKVLVSEVMLQQTQVDRVIVKYHAFLKQFPTIRHLARASLCDVLALWQGLGYNRRAKYLTELARMVAQKHGGTVPRTVPELKALPGIGDYTARAILVFAFNVPSVFIETNIRSVFIRSFFTGQEAVSDKEIFPLIRTTLPKKNMRQWYYALMDYGAMLKREYPNPGRKSAHYTRQTPFKDSNRRIRGLLIRRLLAGPQSVRALARQFNEPPERIESNLLTLAREGFLQKKGAVFSVTREP